MNYYLIVETEVSDYERNSATYELYSEEEVKMYIDILTMASEPELHTDDAIAEKYKLHGGGDAIQDIIYPLKFNDASCRGYIDDYRVIQGELVSL